MWGTIEEECYTSFTVHGRAPDGTLAGPLLGDVNSRDFDVDGSYQLVFSAEKRPGNWIELHPDAHSIGVRSYYPNRVKRVDRAARRASDNRKRDA